jgi:hypothetical protein
MSAGAPDLVEQLHRAAAERYRAEKEPGLALLEQAHRAALEQHRTEQQRRDDLIEQLHRAAAAQGDPARPAPLPAAMVHFTELVPASADNPLSREWNTYRREVARLLAQGGEGRHVLIKDEQVIGVCETHDAAMTAGYQRFPGQPFLVHRFRSASASCAA